MGDKLNKLIKEVGLKEEYYTYFKDSDVIKVIVYDDNEQYDFIISNKFILPLSVYNELLLCLKKCFNNVRLYIDVKDIDYSLVTEYFSSILKDIALDMAKYNVFLDRNITLVDKTLRIDAYNKVECTNLITIKNDIINKLKCYGFKDIDIDINLSLDGNKELINQIENEKVVEYTPSYNMNTASSKKEEVTKSTYRAKKSSEVTEIKDIMYEVDNINIIGMVFGSEFFESKSGYKIITLKVTDYTDSIFVKMFTKDDKEYELIKGLIKENKWYNFYGKVEMDKYANELVFITKYKDVTETEGKTLEVVSDNYKEKRIELHTHTMMSQMDGVADCKKLLKQAIAFGHKAIAITDHNGCQSFPDAYHFVTDYNKGKEEDDKFKVIYGTELTMVDDEINICKRPIDADLLSSTYCVFDLETTGFNAGGEDSIIEIGAVLIKDGEIIDTYNELINPGKKLHPKIIEVTNITDEMLEDKDNEENAIKRFIAWFKDYPMVAHNAKFDTSFIEMCYQKYKLGEFTNCVIDTLELSRAIDTNQARHSLSALVKRYDVPFDETAHHRADYDAKGTAYVLDKMLRKVDKQNIHNINELNSLVSKEDIYKFGRCYHINLLVKNKTGLKNLFKIISLANTKYLYKTPRIPRSELKDKREGLLIGSGCYNCEVFDAARTKSEEELINVINFYDYVEVQPLEVYDHLLQTKDFANKYELSNHIKKIVETTNMAGKLIVATGDVHHILRSDKIYREIIINQKVPGGGRHPLAKNDITNIPSQHLRTTDEMMSDFEFLGDEIAHKIVIENPNKIADMIDIIEVIIETGGVPFSPKIENSVMTVTNLVYTKAQEWYGDPLPFDIEERIAKELYGDIVLNTITKNLEEENNYTKEKAFAILHESINKGDEFIKEQVFNRIKKDDTEGLSDEELKKKVKKSLGGIIGGGFDVIYLIAQKLVKKSNDDGFLVGSRGSVGSSFVATMMGITEVNSLAAHYRCGKCKHSIFNDEDGNPLGKVYSTGFDLPDKYCPKCGEKMIKDGQDMPFATFLGFNADKVPDIDLNFSDLNQAAAHEYTKVLFGVDNVYRAGTIGTVAEKTALGYVHGYFEDKGITNKRRCELERLAVGCTGVKRTTGQHPGGIVVIPGYMDVFDFTPFQYPADDDTSAWRTTHFDYHAIDQDVLKLDILGHTDPTQLRMIQDLVGWDVRNVPLDDKETMAIFLSPEPLGVTKEQIMNETGTLGVPEFGTPFTISMLVDTKPKTFAELIKISGLSHGTDVWLGNAQELIKNNVVPFKDVIGCRDDIMVYLMYKGLEPIKAFKIMEFVRKGKASKDPETWAGHVETMKKAGIEEWFIDSCAKIKYMFPKAHAAAYVISAFRIAYFKVHYPIIYYATYFSTRFEDFDLDVMVKGYDAIKNRMLEIMEKNYDATNKEASILETLKLALEATARGFVFKTIDIRKSDAKNFTILDDKTLLCPFRAVDGLGGVVAQNIQNEAKKHDFISIEDFQNRCKVSSTLIEKMKMMGVFEDMPETSQLSLF